MPRNETVTRRSPPYTPGIIGRQLTTEDFLMRRLAIVLFAVCVATTAFAKDVYLSIGGSAGKFRTDARIFNPSYDKNIIITAR